MFSAVVFIVATLKCEHHDNSIAADKSHAQTSFITAMGRNSSLRFLEDLVSQLNIQTQGILSHPHRRSQPSHRVT